MLFIFGCSKRSGRDKDVSFYRIPKVVSRKGPEILSLSKKRREGYLKAISRVGLTEKILNNDRICSRHFHSGRPADLKDDMNPDWLPSLYLGHKKSLRAAGPVEKMRMARKIARDTKKKEQEVAQSLCCLVQLQKLDPARVLIQSVPWALVGMVIWSVL